MDVARLSETLSWLRVEEKARNIQSKLTTIQSYLQNLSNNPGDTASQVSLSTSLSELGKELDQVVGGYDPAEIARIVDIGGGPFFTRALVDGIKAEMSSNPMSPATVLAAVTKTIAKRKDFVDRVHTTETGVDSFVGYDRGLNSGEADIGFELPRSLFGNEFSDFISELKTLNRVIRVFSETITGEIVQVKLGPISASDPTIFLQAPPVVIAAIAGAVSWILREWKQFEEIRKVRAETAKLGSFSQNELEEFFDKKVKDQLDKAIAEKSASLLEAAPLDQPRKAELNSEVGWALKAVFARIERGMRVEVRVHQLEEPGSDQPEEDAGIKAQRDVLNEIRLTGDVLEFPKIGSEPILSLTDNRAGERAGSGDLGVH